MDKALELGPGTVSSRTYEQSSLLDQSEYPRPQEKKKNVKDKPVISKAERRKLKKGQKVDHAPATHRKVIEEDDALSIQSETKNTSAAGGKVSRGQRAKLKKIKDKYADQDEEERSIRMALLASAGRVDKNEDDAQIQDATTSTTKETGPEVVASKICYKCKKEGHLSRECPEIQEDHARGRPNGTLQNTDGASGTAVSMIEQVDMEEDDIHEIGEEEKGKLNDVDYLTGNPLPNDVLLYAVPVCGPYSALQSYKYRVKIVPGTAKKGKAAKTAMNFFNHMPEATSREKELMKACTDPELVAAMIGNSKITAAGLTQLNHKLKKGKKASSKARS